MAGIRELLQDVHEDGDSDLPTFETEPIAQHLDILLFGVSSCIVSPSILEAPSKPIAYALLDIFLHRIDPVFKVVHAPSLRATILEETPSTPNSLRRYASEALRFACYFTTVCSLDQAECQELFQEDKPVVTDRFRLATEVMLSSANLQTTRDITVLQAFVIYLVRRQTLFLELRHSVEGKLLQHLVHFSV